MLMTSMSGKIPVILIFLSVFELGGYILKFNQISVFIIIINGPLAIYLIRNFWNLGIYYESTLESSCDMLFFKILLILFPY